MFVGIGAFDLSSPIQLLLFRTSQQYPVSEPLGLFGVPTLPKRKAQQATCVSGPGKAECPAAKAKCDNSDGKFAASRDPLALKTTWLCK